MTSELAIGNLTITDSKPWVANQMPTEAEQGQRELIVHLKGQFQPIITVGKQLPNVPRTFSFLEETSNPGFYMKSLYFRIFATKIF